MKHHITVAAVGLAVAGALFAQRDVQTFRATMTGGGGDRGKCTIEVVVDGTAEVQVAGDSGRLVTLGGQPSSWRRMQCNGPIPRNPSDFRFRGIDGRGQVSLAQDPRSNRGIAVVRIDDPKGGSEGYTFDLEWSGGSNDGQGNGGRFGNDRRNDRNGGWNDRNDRNDRWSDRGDRRNENRRDPAYGNSYNTVTCSSDDGRRAYCDTDTRGGVRLLRQLSGSACRQGSTWGFDRRGVWVDRGCRAEFEVGVR